MNPSARRDNVSSQFVEAHGWKMRTQTAYPRMADDAGLHADLRGADLAENGAAAMRSAFFVAVRS